MMEDLVFLQDVELRIAEGSPGLHITSLRVQPGQTVAVLGGAAPARQEVQRLVAALAAADAGSVRVAGQPLQALSSDAAADFRNAHIGQVPADPQFLQRFTVLENVALPLCIGGVARNQREKAAMKLLQDVGLRAVAYARPEKLTRQERLRLGLARALAKEPEVLLLDDVSSAVSEAEIPRWQAILAQVRGGGQAILEFAQEQTLLPPDRKLRIQHGELVEDPT